jgi:hydrogenase expression/formation protein HypD
MKQTDSFRSADLASSLAAKLQQAVTKPIKIMEVCGSHTMSIFHHGIRELLPTDMQLLSGPGCPVCVTPQGYIDTAIQLAQNKEVILASFGDMLRVPGNHSSLLQEKAAGHDIRVLYSPLDAVEIAAANPERQVVFLGVGFETTAPVVALTILEAAKRNLNNYSVFSAHKLVPPAMEALCADSGLQVDGFLCPGHVSTVIGLAPYRFLAEKYHKPAVIAGFEIVDILHALLLIVEMLYQDNPAAVNAYPRAVADGGNPTARKILNQLFTAADSTWRGLGLIPHSGLQIRPEFAGFDAAVKFGLKETETQTPNGCSCGDILRGLKTPPQCLLYKKICTPQTPMGACMVSSEGACAAYYKYVTD